MSAAVHPAAGPAWDRIQRGALLAAAGGLGLFLLVAVVLYFLAGSAHQSESVRQLFLSYLVAYNFWLGVALGCLVILMLQYLTGGAWGIVIRRVLESGTRTLGLLAVLFVPLVFGLSFLYLWAQPKAVDASEDLRHKSLYFNGGFTGMWYIIRAAGYFVVWLLVAYFLNKWSADQDREAVPREQRRFRLLSGPGLVLYGLTITFASVDWVMSLEPFWYSTIYPVLFATGQVLTGFAFAVTVVILLATRPPLSEVITPRHLRDLGSLLLAFVMFWAYMSVSQLILIWVGNLPEEIPWYLRRSREGWQGLAIVIVLCHFALPFLLLLYRDIKKDPRRLAAVAVGLLVMRFIDVFWWIEPAYRHDGEYVFWLLDIAATVGLGGLWVWWFVGQLKSRPLLPTHDPYYAEAVRHD